MNILTVGVIIVLLLVGGIITGFATKFILENLEKMTPEQQQEFLRELSSTSTLI